MNTEERDLRIQESKARDEVRKEAQLRRLVTKSQFANSVEQRANTWKDWCVTIASPRFKSK